MQKKKKKCLQRKIKHISLHPRLGSKHRGVFDLVAQLVEQMTLNHWVEGSSPSQVTQKRCVMIEFLTTHLFYIPGSNPNRLPLYNHL